MFDQALLVDENAPLGKTSFEEEGTAEAWVGQRVPWDAALVGALPFLLFGLTYLLDGFVELGGHNPLAFHLLDSSFDLPAIILAPQMGVYLLSTLGLLIGVLKGFPRWSYSYLGMSLYFGWYYSNGRFYGVEYNSWAWLPSFAAIILGLLLTRSTQPLARLLQGAWNDWTRLSFSLYAFALPMLTVVFFDEDWGAFQLYGLVFDTLLLAAMAVAFLRSRSTLGRVLSLQAAVLILVFKGLLLGGWLNFGKNPRLLVGPAFLFMIIYFGFLLLPALIGLLRRAMDALSSPPPPDPSTHGHSPVPPSKKY